MGRGGGFRTVVDGRGVDSLDFYEQPTGIMGTLARLALRGSFVSDSYVFKASIGEDWCAARIIWRINGYINCWRKSMAICEMDP